MVVLHMISGGESGGSKNHLLSLVLNTKGIKNIILCFINGRLFEEGLRMGLDIRYIKQKRRFDMSILKDIEKICRDENVDIINCHGGRANFIGFFLKKKYSAKYITTIHSDYRDDYKGNFYKTLFYSNINKFVLKYFDYYITVSDSFKNMLVKRGFNENKIFVVYNGIDFNRGIPNFNKELIIKKYNIPFANHYVSMIARLHPVKGHKVFLKSIKRVLEEFSDVVFILVGDGSIRKELEEYALELKIKDKVVFAGFQKPDEFIYISDFTVLTSFTESFPFAILESAFYKKTVISTNVGGISKIIDNGINGFLIKPGDFEQLSLRMLELLNDKNKALDYGLNLYNKALKNFSIQKLSEDYRVIYETITNGGHYNEKGDIPWS